MPPARNPSFVMIGWQKQSYGVILSITAVTCNLEREAAVTAALALRQQFTIHGDVLKRVKVYKYLGWMMAQDDNDTQAIRAQL